MENLPPQQQAEYANLFRASRSDIDAGVVAANHHERKRYWGHWVRFIEPLNNVEPMLTYTDSGTAIPVKPRVELLNAFARRVRDGTYARNKQRVKCQTVQVALRAIGTTFELDGRPNLTYRVDGRYLLGIERQLEGYKRADPPAQAKLAIPVKVVNHIHDVGQAKATARAMAIADMCLIAFYFLLRVGEYTAPRKGADTRTVQFRARDKQRGQFGTTAPSQLHDHAHRQPEEWRTRRNHPPECYQATTVPHQSPSPPGTPHHESSDRNS